ncbi:hypothetical protein NDU88_006750 [Pleurodeles waltl]|uniref:Prolactin receptor n=1 Tax=Pleurodeles waltl TaxID=8319 RepID=A0AAV7MD50_PLEWA|nr:hypothetical protein NDU88_006750 [Pleurodeles waltl]
MYCLTRQSPGSTLLEVDQERYGKRLPNHRENEISVCPSSPLQDESHPLKGSLHSEEEERQENNFRVLTLASGRKEGPDLETASSQWQPKAEPGENSAERP